jgi:hypothetical protein
MTAQTRTTTDAPHVLRDVAEQSAAQAKENLETMSAAAGQATDLLKHGLANKCSRYSGRDMPDPVSRLVGL